MSPGQCVACRLLSLVLLFGGVVNASSQELAPLSPTPPPPTPHPFGQLRLGTLSLTPTFKISNIGWDTNVFDISGEERKPADFTATFDPGLETRITTNRLDIRALTHATFVYYQTYKSEQAINPVIDLTADDRLSSHLSVYVKGLYGYSKERQGYEIDSRPRTLSQDTTFGVRLANRKTQLDLHGHYSDIAYDENAKFLDVNLARTMNQQVTGGGASLGYALSPYTTVTFGADQNFHRFPLDPVRDMNTTSTSAGVRFDPRAVISGSAAIGYEIATPLSPLTPAFAGITPRGGLTYKLRDMFTLGVGGERSLQNSFYSDRPYYIQTLYEGSTRLALFHHFDIGASLQFTTLDYTTFTDAVGSPAQVDKVRMETVNIGVPINRQFRAGCFIQQWRRLSDERPYDTQRIGIEMTIGPATLSPRGIFLSGPGR